MVTKKKIGKLDLKDRVHPTSFKFRPEWLAEMKEASVKLGFVSFTDFVVASMNDAVERKLKAKR